MPNMELNLNGTTIHSAVGGPWEINSNRYRLALAATPRGPGVTGWPCAGGAELVGAPHPLCDLITGGEVKTTAAAETLIIGGRQALSLLLSTTVVEGDAEWAYVQ